MNDDRIKKIEDDLEEIVYTLQDIHDALAQIFDKLNRKKVRISKEQAIIIKKSEWN